MGSRLWGRLVVSFLRGISLWLAVRSRGGKGRKIKEINVHELDLRFSVGVRPYSTE